MQLSAGMRPDASLHTLKVAEGKITPSIILSLSEATFIA